MTSYMHIYLEFVHAEKLICASENRYLLLNRRFLVLVIHLLCIAYCKLSGAFDESQ